jgi:hypothetical protein
LSSKKLVALFILWTLAMFSTGFFFGAFEERGARVRELQGDKQLYIECFVQTYALNTVLDKEKRKR